MAIHRLTSKRTAGRLYLLASALALWAGPLAAACEQWVARLISAQGQVEMQTAEGDTWRPTETEQRFCPGDKVRTLKQSRASLQLPNQTYISLDQSTTVVFSHVEADKPSWIELLTGALFARSRTPKSLDIRTPFINAAIKGTEFMVTVGAGKGEVTVFEGEVEASNADGQVTVSGGQSASAAFGEAPKTRLALRPEDTVQWALYFPPLLDLAKLQRETTDPAVAEAAKVFAAGNLQGALAALDRVPEARRDAEYITIRVSMLLSVGRLDEAEPLLEAAAGKPVPASIDALRSVIALARNRKSEAMELADQALKSDPKSPVAWIARSYVLQAAFDLKGALQAADRAAELNAGDALIEARRAELLASLDRWSEAREAAGRATRIDPRQSRAYVVKGFAELRDSDLAAAETSFHTATGLDPGDPLARLGLGLAAIHRGNLTDGTADLELAANLDPSNSLIRSYLGKAYYEQKRNAVAEKQFELAEQFDPKDPTPWFYDAIKKQTENRPVEALHDLQKAIELNGNRAVYRSKLALDEDLAARGAALGRIYNELGFQPRGLVEGWKAVAENPADYTSHRLLSDTYSGLPRHEIAKVSELLQSQLLQPINVTPVQPQLAEGSLFLLSGVGPAALSLQEFNPLFERNRFSLLASGLVGSNNTYGNELVHSGLWDDFSYSLGQFHYQTRGYFKNNDIDANVYNAFAQGRVTPWLNLQGEYRHRETETGNLDALFAPTDFLRRFQDTTRHNAESDTYRFGVHLSPTESSHFLGSYIHYDESSRYASGEGDSFFQQHYQNRGDTGEVQYIQYHESFKAVLGGGYYEAKRGSESTSSTARHGNGYLYTYLRYPESVHWTLGVSADGYDSGIDSEKTRRQVNPKVGVLWNVTPDTLFRAAGFRTLKRSVLAIQTLEPTQVAGFNQFYDDFDGAEITRWGVGLDQRFGTTLLGGVEASRRHLKSPLLFEGLQKRKESVYRGYLLWTPHPRWAGSAEYFRENFDNLEAFGPPDTETQAIPVSLSYFDPSGIYGRLRSTFFHQRVQVDEGHESDGATFLDLTLGYRLPRRLGIFEVQFQNLLDQGYRYQGLVGRRPEQTSSVPSFMPFPPEFTVFARLTLAM